MQGELGLAAFRERGDVPIAEDGRGTKQSSPLITAFVLGLAATGGGLLLSTLGEVGGSVVATGTPALPGAAAASSLDEKTRLMLTVSEPPPPACPVECLFVGKVRWEC